MRRSSKIEKLSEYCLNSDQLADGIGRAWFLPALGIPTDHELKNFEWRLLEAAVTEDATLGASDL